MYFIIYAKILKNIVITKLINNCYTSLDLSGWNMSNVTNTTEMFKDCSNLKEITMKNCSSDTIGKIQTQLTTDGITGVKINQ